MLDIESVRIYCLSKKATTEGIPFGPDVLVFKVAEKMFATLSLSGNRSMNLKCNPTLALELRDQYDAVIPGYHMNKKHWNTIDLDLLANEKLLHEWIDHSYDLVWQKLPKRIKTAFDLDQ